MKGNGSIQNAIKLNRMVTLLKRIYWVETKWNGNWDDWNQNAIS